MPDHGTPPAASTRESRHLDSWGEIATHLHRSISTVQRWERQEGLPVHRIAHSKLGSVYALTSELDAWYESRSRTTLRAEHAGEAVAGAPNGRMTLAVLPFQNLSGSPDQDYFSDGLTEELITHLTRLRPDRLAVIARTSAMQYRNTGKDVRAIGAELGVAYVLEGSVRRGGDRVRASAQLVATSDGTYLWADSYEQPLTDVIAIQTAIAERVGDSLSIHLLSQDAARLPVHRPSPEAFDEYLKGRYFWNTRTPEGLRRALHYFQRAIAFDPQLAAAHAGLADTYAVLGFWAYGALPPKEAFPLARGAAERAVKLDPGLSEAYVTLGFAQYAFDWDWAGAERSFRHALELNPGYATAHQRYASLLALQGRAADALAEVARARVLDPLSLLVNHTVAWLHYYARDYEQAREHCARTLEINPSFQVTRLLLGTVYSLMGRAEEALHELDVFDRLSGPTALGIVARACHHARASDRRQAENALAELRRQAAAATVFSWHFALVHASMGAVDEAFAALERALEERSDFLAFLKVEPQWDPLRGDPRFGVLLKRIGLA